jgi:hypothetical protein
MYFENCTKIPKFSVGFRLRSQEAIGYDSTTSTVYEFNETAIAALRKIDGESSILVIAKMMIPDETITSTFAETLLKFYESCIEKGFMQWKY